MCNGGNTLINVTHSGGWQSYDSSSVFPPYTPFYHGILTDSINGLVYNASTSYTAGTYTVVATDGKGCTKTTVITLVDPAAITSSTSVTACNSYTWSTPLGNGVTYTTGGTYTKTSLTVAGCLQTDSLVLTINTGVTNTTTQTQTGGTFTWSVTGITYTVSGTYTGTSLNANGCTNTENLNLTINPILGGCGPLTVTVLEDQAISC